MGPLFKKTATAAAAPIVPSLTEASPAYAGLLEKRSELRARRANLEREESAIRAALQDYRPDRGQAERVAALLDEPAPEQPAGPDRLAEIAGEIRDIDAALSALEQRIARERHAASAKICDALRKPYAAAVRKLADALVASNNAHAELHAITDHLNANDVAWSGNLMPMQAGFLGSPRDNAGRLATWVRDAVRGDFVAPESVPESLR